MALIKIKLTKQWRKYSAGANVLVSRSTADKIIGDRVGYEVNNDEAELLDKYYASKSEEEE